MFFGHTVFLKLRIRSFSDTQKTPIIVAGSPKIFHVQCIWGRIFEPLKKIFVFKYSYTILHLYSFYMKNIWKKCYKNFFGCIFLGAHTVQTVPKYNCIQQ